MTSERIKEIQSKTAYPNSVSVQQALLTVWNECEQERVKNCSTPAVSNLLCGSFDPNTTTSSGTKCKCGREKWEHPKAKN